MGVCVQVGRWRGCQGSVFGLEGPIGLGRVRIRMVVIYCCRWAVIVIPRGQRCESCSVGFHGAVAVAVLAQQRTDEWRT